MLHVHRGETQAPGPVLTDTQVHEASQEAKSPHPGLASGRGGGSAPHSPALTPAGDGAGVRDQNKEEERGREDERQQNRTKRAQKSPSGEGGAEGGGKEQAGLAVSRL